MALSGVGAGKKALSGVGVKNRALSGDKQIGPIETSANSSEYISGLAWLLVFSDTSVHLSENQITERRSRVCFITYKSPFLVLLLTH